MKFLVIVSLAAALPAFGQGVAEQLSGSLHDKCVAHGQEILRRDWHIPGSTAIDTAKFCECADKGADYARILGLVSKVPESDRPPGSKPIDALEASYFIDGLRCYSQWARWAGWSNGLPVGPARRSLEEVRLELDKHKGAIYSAYNLALKGNPTLAGKVTLEFTIESSGQVRDVKVGSSQLTDTAMLDAIKSEIAKLEFPAEPVAKLVVTYPIDFLPK